ncbi:YigZ family protein [Sanguibacter suarezii]|uniref:YigZ family protein n=1 Tax=Sanguibacter suarezii TaxID=60921 RepID=UPI000A40C772|nr:YigZ family protein [Sanguibacter suarezii]
MTSPVPPQPPSTGSGPLLSTISGTTVHELVVKKSRFITRVSHVDSLADAEAVIAAVRKQYWDARHNCTALVVGPGGDQQRSSDDGEPSGTAGIPMLEVLRHRGLTDVVAVVTRYFGGVLLGAGGLVRAYSTAVSQALDAATLVRREMRAEVVLQAGHSEAGRLEHVLRDWSLTHQATFLPVVYDVGATFTLLVPPARIAQLEEAVAAATAGAVSVDVRGWQVTDVPG